MCICCSDVKVVAELNTVATLQAASTSRGRGVSSNPHGQSSVANPLTCSVPERPPMPQARNTRTSQVIAIKDGDPVPEGYRYLVPDRAAFGPPSHTEIRSPVELTEFRTPSKTGEQLPVDDPASVKSRTAARRNLTRSKNRVANASFVREMKESLATGRPTTIKVSEENNDLKGMWHAAAKEVAYKFLDLRKDNWKDYSLREKGMIHNELKEQYKFDPPLDPKSIDKYLSGHLRTSRAVWKAHWKKYGDTKRHHNCPEEAWEKLTKWWCTDACQEESADMASRRVRVQRSSKMGRNSLLDRMDEEVSAILIVFVEEHFYCYIL